jgi:2-hydroxy-3-oxopropionate reductase
VPEKKLGFIGLGIMGRPMCRNLIDAGYPVSVWNRSQPGIEECAGHGAMAETSARAVAERSEVVITMVTGSSDVWEVVLGPNGVLEGARPGMILIDMTTISPRVTKEIARKLNEKGVRMLDAPVSGGDRGAREGTLSIMVGGPAEVFQQCVPILEVLGRNIIHIGEENGVGQSTKLCNQVVGALNVLAVCEGFTLAAKSKLDMEKMFSAVKAGAAGSWQLDDLGPKILSRDWEPGFMVKTAQKDLRLVMEAAGDLGICLPGVALVHQLHHAAEAEGLGDKGTQALIRAFEKLANVEVRK